LGGDSRTGETAAFEPLLRAELAPRGIDLCPERGGHVATAVATVELAPHERATAIVVVVRDAVTAKRVERDVDLVTVPIDGQPLTLALAADELLRASWAELALATSPTPGVPVPKAVSDDVDASMRPARPPRAFLGALAATEHYSGGQTQYGGDLEAGVWITRRLSLGARAGLRSALSASAPDGNVSASTFLVGLDAALAVTPPAWRWTLDALARFGLEHIDYLATAAPGAHALDGSATALLASAGARVSFGVWGPLRLDLEALVDVPVRPVQATDSGGEVVGVSGVGARGALGARAAF
jgi:hypothetical protein